MTDLSIPVIIGVDAGGSKTTAWASDGRTITRDGPVEPSGRGMAGPGNPHAIGMELAIREIELAITLAFDDMQRRFAKATLADQLKLCLSVAGAGRDSEKVEFGRWASSRFPGAMVRVTDDAQPVLAAASDQQVGIALISGTGSFAWGRNSHGISKRCGGWGYLFGDEGSGYRIGQSVLQAASQCADGRGEPTVLLDRVCRWFDIGDPSTMIERVYNQKFDRRELAKLSEIVFEVAGDDPVANRIVQNAAKSLAQHVDALAGRLDFEDCDLTLAMGGGLLIHHERLRAAVLENVLIPLGRIEVVVEPVAGAVRLASQL